MIWSFQICKPIAVFWQRLYYQGEHAALLCSFLLDDVVNHDPSHFIFVIEVNQRSVFSELKEHVDCCCVST
jgi:hypothetical protein